MANGIKYSASAQTQALKKGDFWIATGDVGKGSDYYSEIPPSAGGYTIYLNKASGGPSIICPANDAQLIYWTKQISGNTYATAAECLNWFAGQSDKMVFNRSYPAIVTNGLVLNVDAGFTPSYPTTGSAWYDMSSAGNNGTLTNSPIFNSADGGNITLDGIDDYINLGNASSIRMGVSDFTISVWVKILTQNGAPTFRGLITSKQAAAANAGYGFYWNNSENKFLWSTANGSAASEIYSTNTFSSLINTWANIVMIRQNGATKNGCFYINGTYESLASSATILNVDTANNMNLGNTADFYSAYWFKGTYGSVQIYNRALSEAEVLQNYNAQKGRFVSIVTDSLIMNLDAGNTSSYPGTGTLWTDLSGQNNNATLVNGPAFSSSNGGVISFDGANDNAQWASGGEITTNLNTWYNDESRTLQMWINFSNLNLGQLQSITSTGYDEVGYGFAISNSRWAMFANGSYSTIGNALSTNTWYFVTLLRTGTSSWTIYQGTTNLGNVTQSAGTPVLGADYQFQLMCNGYGNHKQGAVGQVLFYNKVLSAAEIQNNYEATKSRFGL